LGHARGKVVISLVAEDTSAPVVKAE